MIVSGRARFHDELGPLMADIDSVVQHPENYNQGDTEAIVESIQFNGMYRPIFVREATGEILAGNHTWAACKELGATEIPVVRLDVDDVDALKIMVADNRIAAAAMPDNHALLRIMQVVAEQSVLEGTGVSAKDMEVLEHLAEMEPLFPAIGWPTLTFTVHPNHVKAFREMTHEADTDADKFELLLRLAGWDGR